MPLSESKKGRKKRDIPISQQRRKLHQLFRLYAVAGDKEKRKAQAKLQKEMKKVRWDATRLITHKFGIIPATEWFALMGEYINSARRLADSGDSNLPHAYKKGLNTLIRNKEKHLEFLRNHLSPADEELAELDQLLMGEIVHLSGYIRCMDKKLGEDEELHWAKLNELSAQTGVLLDAIVERGREKNESKPADRRPPKHGDEPTGGLGGLSSDGAGAGDGLDGNRQEEVE